MDVSLSSIALAIVLISSVTWSLNLLNWLWLRPKRLENRLRRQGLNGNPYRMLYGDMIENSVLRKAANSKPIGLSDDIVPRILPFLCHNTHKYGKNFFMWFGTTPRIIVRDPEQIKEVFGKFNSFPKLSQNPFLRLLAVGLANQDGEKWAVHRKIINPAFRVDRLKYMLPAAHLSCNKLISQWNESISATNGSSCELDVWPYIQVLAAEIISRSAFGSSYDEGKIIFQLQREQAQLVLKAVHLARFPGRSYLPTKLNRRMKEVHREVFSLLRGIIRKREEAMKEGSATQNDLLGTLLESNSIEIKENGGRDKNLVMSMDDIIEECKLFYLAGQETTAVLLIWSMVLLSQHQTWQDRARTEVLQVFGDKKPEFEGLAHLKVVTMILYEVLRMYPPVVALARAVHKETKLGKMSIPPGAEITLPTLLIHHDKDIWGADAGEFNPERFADGVASATKNRVCYFPFGWGARICVGQNFALANVKSSLAMMLQRFVFELSPSYKHAPLTVLHPQPQHGCPLVIRRLK